MSEVVTVELERLVSLVTDKVTVRKDASKSYVGLEHIPSEGSALLGFGSSADSISTNNVFRAGDTLFGKLRPRLRKSIRAPFDGYCSTDILVLRANDFDDSAFASFVLKSDAVFGEAIRTEEGTKMPRCSWQSLKTAKVFCPEHPQQRWRIAEILSTVDGAMEQTEALIAKYQQIKAGLMHDLFTRGVTPDGLLRPDRADAPQIYKKTVLGWIPKEWDVTTPQDCGSVKLGRQRSPDQMSGRWTTPYLRVANVFDGFIDYRDVLEMDFTPNEKQVFSLKRGDILLNEGQSLELVGRCALFDGPAEKFCFQNTLVRFRPFEKQSPLFYRFLFKWFLDCGLFMRIAKQTTSVAHLGADRFAKMKCVAVPFEEQQHIAERLGAVQSLLDIEQSRSAKLRAQKQGLMQDLLTGRVPVNVAETVVA